VLTRRSAEAFALHRFFAQIVSPDGAFALTLTRAPR
jgi:hypothetical protein